MVEIESMVPIAAVVDLVLGIATLSIISRSQGASANNKIVGCILGWILVFLERWVWEQALQWGPS